MVNRHSPARLVPGRRKAVNALKKIGSAITKLNNGAAFVGAMFMFPLIIVVCLSVFNRYVLRSPDIYSYDLTWMFYAVLSFLGGGYALQNEVHVRADVFLGMLKKRGQAVLNIIGYVLFFFPSMIGLLFSTWDLVVKAFKFNETSPYTSWNPSVAPIKTVLFVSMILLTLQGIVKFAGYIKQLKEGNDVDEANEVETVEGGDA